MTTTEQPIAAGADGSTYPAFEYNYWNIEPILSHAQKMDELRDQYPFFRSTYSTGFWVVTDSEHVREALQRPDLFSSLAVIALEPDPPYNWIPEMLDPPVHTKWRQLLAPTFSPGSMAKMADKVRQRCVDILDTFADRGHCDFLADFAWRYPTTIFMDLMGLPVEEADKFLVWEHDILHLPVDQDPDRSRAYKAMQDVRAYFADLIEERRRDPHDDLLSSAISWQIDGQPIPEDDLLSMCLLMFMAGLDTVSIQLSYSFWHLATHPADRARIVNEPEIIPSAVEELLRAYSFVPTGRRITQDMDFHGCPMKKGDMVVLPIPSVNRDPALYPGGPDVVLDRKANNHIAFGAGPHRCVGSHLARRELTVALEEWHKRIPEYRLDESVPVVEHGGMFGVDALALLWDA